jgi:CO/xanthine dehydrogenase Mo-binding subunit
MLSYFVAIPTYWSHPGGAGPRMVVYDHPTPLDSPGTLRRTLESLTPLVSAGVQVGVVAAAASLSLEKAVESRVQDLIQAPPLPFPVAFFSASHLECNPKDLEARDRRIYVKGNPDHGLSWNKAIRACFDADKLPLVVKGSTKLPSCWPDWNTGMGNMSPAYTFAAQAVEVDVDRETGVVKIDTVSAAHDCGRAINPTAAEGQVHGSLANALSMAM